MARRPLVAANWKMYKTRAQARAFVEEFLPLVRGTVGVDVVLCPPFTALDTVAEVLEGQGVAWGAQDVYWEDEGAFTGEVSPGMLVEVGCRYVIVGHSERRRLFGETGPGIARKVKAALGSGLIPILCVGESLAEREAGDTERVVATQLREALADIDARSRGRIVVAYEPVWAIGTGCNARPEDAAAVAALIREEVGGRVLYGGSVKPDNIAGFAGRPEVDGALVGGASLDAHSFAAIVAAFAARPEHPAGVS